MGHTTLIQIGFGNTIAIDRVIAIALPNSAPIKRIIHEARNKWLLIDMTSGRRTKSVIIIDNGYVILSALAPETIVGRYQASKETGSYRQK